MKNLSLLLFVCLFWSVGLRSQTSDETSPAPEDKKFDWSPLATNKALWFEQEQLAFDPQKKWSTNGVLIIADDHILYERYENGFSETKPHRLWSITKSFASFIVGKRLEELEANVHLPAWQFMPELKRPTSLNLTLKHLLQMSSGLAWNEFYETNPFQSDVVAMLYLDPHKDMATFTANHPQKYRPGFTFNYSSGETNLLMGIIKKSFGEEVTDYLNFPWKVLFDPLGITTATWETDSSQTFVGSSYLFMTPRDLARFGRLYLQRGLWEEQQLISSRFIEDSLKVAPASCLSKRKGRGNDFSYGYQWWLNRPCPEKKTQAFPNLPENVFLALGHHGQTMAIFPGLNSLVIRTAADKKKRFPLKKWLSSVYKGLLEYRSQKEATNAL